MTTLSQTVADQHCEPIRLGRLKWLESSTGGRRLIVDGLNTLRGVRCVMARGAFYAFANVSGPFGRTPTSGGPLSRSADVAAFLLDEARLAVVPGVDFGADAHVRLSYTTSADLIREGLARMDAAIHRLRDDSQRGKRRVSVP